MTDFIFESRFAYHRFYVQKGYRKLRRADVIGECPVTVSEIEPDAAPVSYKILSLDKPHESHEVRSYAGSLWWPICSASGPLEASDFRLLTETDWESASAILDPMRHTYRYPGVSEKEFFKDLEIRKDKDSSTLDQRIGCAHRDASRMIFCQGRVLVEAGDPVWYFIPREDTRGGVELVAGFSSLDRRAAAAYFTPGPDRHVRLGCALAAHAFSIAEIEAAKEVWTEHEPAIHVKSQIEVTTDYPAASAADLCARALCEHLWDIAWMHPDLRRAVPAVEHAWHSDPAPEMLPYSEMLEQLVSLQNARLRRNHSRIIMTAKAIIGRLEAAERQPLAEEDDAALADLRI